MTDKRKDEFTRLRKRLAAASLLSLFILVAQVAAQPDLRLSANAADNLRLREGISFVQDTDNGFPIIAENIEDADLDTEKPTLVFFGASGDLNTNRQAKRLVDLYKRYVGRLKVILIDVDHPANAKAKALIKSYYKGYIPLEVIVDRKGKVVFTHAGEVETGQLKSQIEKVL